jgi:hypothetical protein
MSEDDIALGQGTPCGLLDLGFLEFHVLARHGIVFLEGELLGLGARILLGHIEVTGVGGRRQLDLDNVAFGHDGLRMEGLRAIDPNCPKKSSFAGFGLWVQFEFQNWSGGPGGHV